MVRSFYVIRAFIDNRIQRKCKDFLGIHEVHSQYCVSKEKTSNVLLLRQKKIIITTFRCRDCLADKFEADRRLLTSFSLIRQERRRTDAEEIDLRIHHE
jgi:hypothetical protein